jgi:hypothetical protein
LIVRLLDQIDVVLRIGGAQQAWSFADRNAVGAGAIAIDVDIEVRAGCETDSSAAAPAKPS